MENKGISNAVIKRLPRYYRYLSDLMNEGVERISSNELSGMMSVTASQIRQDLNNFGGFGQQGYGYNVEYLHGEIGKILCVDKKHDMVIIGGGNFGHALANYEKFEQKGFVTRAIFDRDPNKVGQSVRGIPILDIAELPAYLENHRIQIGVLTIPKREAQEITDTLVAGGVKAIWNFAHLDLKAPAEVVVENVHLSESLMQLSYRLGEQKS